MALPTLNSNVAVDRYNNVRDLLTSKALGAIGGAIEYELPGVSGFVSSLSSALFSPVDQNPASKFQRQPANQNSTGALPNMRPLTVLLLSIAKNTGKVPMLLELLTKRFDRGNAELKVIGDLLLRLTNLNKSNLAMMRTYAKLGMENEREDDFNRQIAASKFVKVTPTTPAAAAKPAQQSGGLLGMLQTVFAPIGRFFKGIMPVVGTLAAVLGPIVRLVARVGLVDLPMIGLIAAGGNLLWGGLKKFYNGYQQGDRGFKKGASNFLMGVKEQGDKMTQVPREWLTKHMKNNKDFYIPLIKALSNLFGAFVAEPIKFAFKAVFSKEKLTDTLKSFWKNFWGHVAGFGESMNQLMKPISNALADKVFIPAKDKIVSVFESLMKSVFGFFEDVKTAVVDYVQGSVNAFMGSIKSMLRNIIPEDNKILGMKAVNNKIYEFAYGKDSAPAFPADQEKKEPPKSGMQKVQKNSKEAQRAAKMIVNQQNINNYNFAKNAQKAQVVQPAIIAPSTNVKTNNFLAMGTSTRNPNAQSIIKDNVAQ